MGRLISVFDDHIHVQQKRVFPECGTVNPSMQGFLYPYTNVQVIKARINLIVCFSSSLTSWLKLALLCVVFSCVFLSLSHLVYRSGAVLDCTDS